MKVDKTIRPLILESVHITSKNREAVIRKTVNEMWRYMCTLPHFSTADALAHEAAHKKILEGLSTGFFTFKLYSNGQFEMAFPTDAEAIRFHESMASWRKYMRKLNREYIACPDCSIYAATPEYEKKRKACKRCHGAGEFSLSHKDLCAPKKKKSK